MGDHNDKSIENILSADELTMLFEMMTHPGWSVMKKMDKAMREDWIEQASNADMSDKTDDEMIRVLRHRQGQIKGMSLFMSYLEKKKSDRERRAAKDEH